MRTKLLVLAAALAPVAAFAAGGGGANLDQANNDITNKASLQRGASNFVNYCLGCHSAKFVRYNRMAADIGLTEQQLIDNLMFTAESPHETMRIGINADDAKRWFGVVPPDLSLVARSRGTDYLYTFLRSFYADPAKALGTNNLVLPGTAMPHVLWELQGVQEAVWAGEPNAQGDVSHEFKEFRLVKPGRLTVDEYDAFVRDTVNFLEYMAEPAQLQRRSLGFPVIAFLLFFTLLAWALKKEYWKDVK
jgi:ubiquinol-cytochrome c reductase cytochrome c1 subunit